MKILDDKVVAEIEKYIFQAWEMDMSGQEVISYVCSMTQQPSFYVEPVVRDLVKRMIDEEQNEEQT